MGVCQMKKVRVVAHEAHRSAAVSALQDAGILELRDVETEGESPTTPNRIEEEIQNASQRLEKLARCFSLAERFHPPRKLVENLSGSLISVESAEVARIRRETNVDSVYEECVQIETQLSRSRSMQEESVAKTESLKPWKPLTVSLDDLNSTSSVGFVPVTIPSTARLAIENDIESAKVDYLVYPVSSVGKIQHLLIGFWRKSDEDLQKVLTAHGVRPARFPVTDKPPAEAISELVKTRVEAAERETDARKHAEQFSSRWYDQLAILVDEAATMLNQGEAGRLFLYTERTFCLEGWVPEDEIVKLEKALAAVGREIHVIVGDPEPEDDVPVTFQNKRLFRPLEFVLGLYGRPLYGTVDPVPYFSPFFIIFFGLCLSDAGYGIVVALGGLFILKKIKPSGGLRDMSMIAIYGGISTFVVGFLTGGWFGISSEHLPKVMRGILDPIKDPMTMLYIALGFGVVQLIFGLAIKMGIHFFGGRWKDAVYDQLLWILFIMTLVPLCYHSVFGEEVSPWILSLAGKSALVLVVLLVLTQGRSQQNVFLRIPAGILKLYDTVGIFGDVLSYARLLALGLATTAIATAFNGIAAMTIPIPYGIGYLIAALILLGGHSFNIAINCLGAFVHSARLQYLEFFSKFFESGGRVFRPLKRVERYSTVVRRPS